MTLRNVAFSKNQARREREAMEQYLKEKSGGEEMGKLSQEEINVDLFDEVKRLRQENACLKTTLSSCRYHAKNIIDRDYAESMDAHTIIEDVNEALGDE